MLKKSNWSGQLKVAGLQIKDPRVAMRAVIGALLLANLGVAVVAFKPFGGSADDLRQEQAALSTQLSQLQTRLDAAKRLVDNMEIARTQGDEFLEQYIMEERSLAGTTLEEMTRIATDSGIRAQQAVFQEEPVEGSDTLQMVSIQQGFEGTYANLTKLINLLDKSPRFLIIDAMNLNAPQQQNVQQGGPQLLRVTLTVITYVRSDAGVVL